ncbi:MAG: MFS transporter [Acidobacteria bacterium]|nr:MFS transporter [Acidobacteriota bacterium]
MATRLKKSVLYSYGIADMFFGLLIAMEVYFFPVFLTDYAQFSLVVVGQILLFTSIIDIFCTLGGGFLLQKTTLKFGGKYRSWFLAGPALAAPLFVLQFTKIGNDWTAAVIIIAGFIASHILFNVFFSASGAMVGRLSQLPDEITLLSASRAQGMAASGIIFSLTGLPMIMFLGKHFGDIKGHAISVGVYALLMIFGYLYLYWITAGKDPYDKTATGPEKGEEGLSMKTIAGLVLSNPPLIFLSFAEIFRNTYIFIVTGFAIYYFKYVLDDVPFVSIFILAISIAGLIGSLAASWIGVKIGKRRSYWICLLLAAAGFASASYLRETSWMITSACCVASMFGMIAGAMSTALFTDTAIYGEWKRGSNIRAFIMAVCNVPIKVGVFIRSAILSLGLMAIGFVANMDPTPAVVEGIRAIMIFAPAVACVLAAAVFYFGYKIKDSQVLFMQEEIAQRRAASNIEEERM